MSQYYRTSTPHRWQKISGGSCTLSLLLLLGIPSLANASPHSVFLQGHDDLIAQFTPIDPSPPKGDHTSGSTLPDDICGEQIEALAPRFEFIGKTISTRPTFVWYIFGEKPEYLQFRLYRYGADAIEKVFTAQLTSIQNGLMGYSLPQDAPELKAGETYRWQVIQYCDQNYEEIGSYSSADIEVVESPTELTSEISNPTHWYDALASVYKGVNPADKDSLESLLKDLAREDPKLSEPLENIVLELEKQ